MIERLPDGTPGAVIVRVSVEAGSEVTALGRGSVEAGSEVTALGRGSVDGPPISADTVFQAASLSKPVIATWVVQLAERGSLDLDAPFIPARVLTEHDVHPEVGSITPRMVLTHTTGLPNWRTPGSILRFTARPGTPGYSGEAFELLLTCLAPVDRNVVLRRHLDDLGMDDSSFVWRNDFEGRTAIGHDERGEGLPKTHPTEARAAGSLHTTGRDYARFLASALSREADTTPREASRASEPEQSAPHTLLWGSTPSPAGPILWQHGDDPGFKHLAALRPDAGDALVVFTNGETGWNLVRSVAASIDLTLW